VSAHNLITLTKRKSLNVYDADIFNCSQQPSPRAHGAHLALHETVRNTPALVLDLKDRSKVAGPAQAGFAKRSSTLCTRCVYAFEARRPFDY
jgi:hypothetical protein